MWGAVNNLPIHFSRGPYSLQLPPSCCHKEHHRCCWQLLPSSCHQERLTQPTKAPPPEKRSMRTKMQNTMEGGYARLARPDPRILWVGTRLVASVMVSHAADDRACVMVSRAADHPDSLHLRSAISTSANASSSFFPTRSAHWHTRHSASSSDTDDLPPSRGPMLQFRATAGNGEPVGTSSILLNPYFTMQDSYMWMIASRRMAAATRQACLMGRRYTFSLEGMWKPSPTWPGAEPRRGQTGPWPPLVCLFF
jgi:hypothetical protein